MTRLIFLVWRGYNDFDHMLPIIHYFQSLNKKNIRIELIFDYLGMRFPKYDQRYKYVKNNKNISSKDVFLGKYNFITKYLEKNHHKKGFYLTRLAHKIFYFIFQKYFLIILKKKINWISVLGDSFKNNEKAVLFVGHGTERNLNAANALKKINNNLKYVLLPHGVTLCKNKLLDETDYSFDMVSNYARQWKGFDRILVPDFEFLNKAKEQNYPFLNKLKVVGSVRFSKEWLKEKKKLNIDGANVPCKVKGVNILIFAPNFISNVFFEEFVRTVDIISNFKQFNCILQIRAFGGKKLPKKLMQKNNLQIIDDEYSSSALVDWSDITFNSVTTMHFECFQKGKIVIYPRYLMANTAICELYNAGIILKNRDDLILSLNEILKDFSNFKKNYFKNSKNINSYLKDQIMASKDNAVLNNYIEIFKKDLELDL